MPLEPTPTDRYPLRLREPLSRWTTLKIGGPAEFFYEPARPEDLAALLDKLSAEDTPWRMLGGGANTLPPDGGVWGAVIHTGGMRRVFREDNKLRAWPGLTLPALVQGASKEGLSGLEQLVGVPGMVGGALAMNAGGGSWGIWECVEEVTLWREGQGMFSATPDEIEPSYRNGNLKGAVVLEALLYLEPKPTPWIRDQMTDLLRRKSATQPVTLSSAGCAFKNPPNDSAGRLIDAAGLKGAREGDAQVSDKHANFIINIGCATAADVRSLIEQMEATVADRFGIQLERELVIWDEPLQPV